MEISEIVKRAADRCFDDFNRYRRYDICVRHSTEIIRAAIDEATQEYCRKLFQAGNEMGKGYLRIKELEDQLAQANRPDCDQGDSDDK